MSKYSSGEKMSKTLTLTPALLRRIILEEKRNIMMEKKHQKESDFPDAEEVDADEYADSLESKQDFSPKMESVRDRFKNLVNEERRLLEKLGKIRESKRAVRSRLIKQNRR
jgi:hypothetical protein